MAEQQFWDFESLGTTVAFTCRHNAAVLPVSRCSEHTLQQSSSSTRHRQIHTWLNTLTILYNHIVPHAHTRTAARTCNQTHTHTYMCGLWTPCQVQLCFHRGTAGPERGYFRLWRPDWIKAGLIPVEFVSFFQATLNPNQIIQPAPRRRHHRHHSSAVL